MERRGSAEGEHPLQNCRQLQTSEAAFRVTMAERKRGLMGLSISFRLRRSRCFPKSGGSQETAAGGRVEILRQQNTTRFLTAAKRNGRRGRGSDGAGLLRPPPRGEPYPIPHTLKKKSALPRLDRADGFSYNTAIASSVCRHLERLPEGIALT